MRNYIELIDLILSIVSSLLDLWIYFRPPLC